MTELFKNNTLLKSVYGITASGKNCLDKLYHYRHVTIELIL